MASDITEKFSKLSVEDKKELKTALVYDPRMKDHRNEMDPSHPESPERINCIWEALRDRGYTTRCRAVKSRDATKDEIELVHEEAHFRQMSATPDLDSSQLTTLSWSYSSIFINQATFPCALLSAGCVVEVTEQVVTGKAKNGIAVVRPGGHHAEAHCCMGFCIFNNVAVAAKVAIEKHAVERPPGHHAEAHCCMGFCTFNNVAIAAKVAIEKHAVERVLIVDWDVHHGNATQHMFYDDKRVLYISLHRYDNGRFFPGRPDGNYTYVGGEGAEGYNVNVAWNRSSMGDAEYLAAFYHLLLPIAYEFSPDLVIISCGFDAAQGDPLGHYQVTPAGYAHMTHLLMGLAGGRVVLALEGGYNLTSISDSMCACAAALLGDPLPPVKSTVPNDSAVECIQNTAQAHSKYWKSLRIFASEPTAAEAVRNETSSEVTPEDRRTSFGRSAPQEATPTAQSRDQEATPTSQQGGVATVVGTNQRVPLSGSQQRIVDTLEQTGNMVMYAVTPKPWCEHLAQVTPCPSAEIEANQICETCGEQREPWVCLTCYHAYCGRYINQHMLSHGETSGHNVVLSLADLSVWCFACDSYIDNQVLHPIKNAAHKSKFGCNMAGFLD